MPKITWDDIVRKLTSRKFWIAIAAFVTNLMVFNGANTEVVERVTALIMAGATVIAYIVGEGLADSSANNTTVLLTPDDVAELNEEEEAEE